MNDMNQPALPPLPCYLNGEYTQLHLAKVSVLDRGFVFGDGVYEVIPIYGGSPFRFAEHMARFDRSLAAMRITNPLSHQAWHALVLHLVAQYAQQANAPTQSTDQMTYLQVTRGVAMRDHAMPAGIAPTVFAMTNRLTTVPHAVRAHGVACVTADDMRWKMAHIKSTSLAGSVLARQISADEGVAETVMFRDGFLSEGSSSNVWVVKDGGVTGPPADNLVLEGVRYGLIESLCHQAGIAFDLRKITRQEVLAAAELLLSSASKEVLAITQLDGRPVGNGRPGPIYEALYAGYQRANRPLEHEPGFTRHSAGLPQGVPHRLSVTFSDQGDGRQSRWVRASGRQHRQGLRPQFRSGLRRVARQQGRQLPGHHHHHHGDQPRTAR